ncbi:glycosyltransferase family 2 protein [Sneathiella glossodoripedis]|uniref:glycosyltransferase family 2 protein n=1 Tax=Sneathiella glossodoripedis TaxID=418853 RepID=UPI00046FD048|nr:glycosyltransferase family 2 protein [Sneathiella glossodoripedis]
MKLDYSKKISIVIPTRNRAEFLGPCIETCTASDDQNLEIVVSDNFSSDNTKQVVETFTDPRVRYVTPGNDVSMRQNFEYALSQADGDFVIFIGDDDGVLANGLKTVRYLINKFDPDVLLWKHITYLWPHIQSEPKEGLLKFRLRDFCGPMKTLDPKTVLQSFADGRTVAYREGANIYHGCIARRLIDAVSSKGGQYFQGQIPDVNTAVSNLVYAKSMLWIRNPVTIAGQGEKSNGAAMNTSAQTTQSQNNIAANFKELAEADSVLPEIDLRIRSIPAYTYANLNLVSQIHLKGQLKLNHERWRHIIVDDLKRFPKQHRCWSVLEEFFEQMDPDYVANGRLAKIEETLEKRTELATEGRARVKKKKRGPKSLHISTVKSTADWINAVTNPPYKPVNNLLFARCKHFYRMILMVINRLQVT